LKQEERARKAEMAALDPSPTSDAPPVLNEKEKAVAEIVVESFQDQLKNRLKKRAEGTGGPVVVEKKNQAVVSAANTFQDQLRNRLKKRTDGDGTQFSLETS